MRPAKRRSRLDATNADAWLAKALAAGGCSTPARPRLQEMEEDLLRALRLAPESTYPPVSGHADPSIAVSDSTIGVQVIP